MASISLHHRSLHGRLNVFLPVGNRVVEPTGCRKRLLRALPCMTSRTASPCYMARSLRTGQCFLPGHTAFPYGFQPSRGCYSRVYHAGAANGGAVLEAPLTTLTKDDGITRDLGITRELLESNYGVKSISPHHVQALAQVEVVRRSTKLFEDRFKKSEDAVKLSNEMNETMAELESSLAELEQVDMSQEAFAALLHEAEAIQQESLKPKKERKKRTSTRTKKAAVSASTSSQLAAPATKTKSSTTGRLPGQSPAGFYPSTSSPESSDPIVSRHSASSSSYHTMPHQQHQHTSTTIPHDDVMPTSGMHTQPVPWSSPQVDWSTQQYQAQFPQHQQHPPPPAVQQQIQHFPQYNQTPVQYATRTFSSPATQVPPGIAPAAQLTPSLWQQQPPKDAHAVAAIHGAAQHKARTRLKKVKKVVRRVAPLKAVSSAAEAAKAALQESMVGYGGETSTNEFFKNISSSDLLEADQEKELALLVQDFLRLEATETQLREKLGRMPDLAELARESDMDIFEFNQRLVRGRAAKKTMLESNMRLVVSIARQFQNRGLPLQELITEGITGLVRGVEKFDPSKGFKFSTYAHWWVRQAVQRSLGEQKGVLRVPSHLQEALNKLHKLRVEWESKKGKPPTVSQLSKLSGMEQDKIKYYLSLYRNVASLDQPLGSDKDSGAAIDDLVAAEDIEDPADDAIHQAMREDLEAVISTLTEREATVLRMRYGLGGYKEMTLEDIGKYFDVTRERIRQIEAKAIRRLRSPGRQALLQDYNDGLEEKRVGTARRSMGTRKSSS